MKKQIIWILAMLITSAGAFYLGRYSKLTYNISLDWNTVLSSLFGPMIVGYVLWQLGTSEANKKIKRDAITDLMTYRGDYSSPDFTKSLNKVAVIFHDDEEIRADVKKLYELMNNPSTATTMTERSVVGLIYKLCRRHGFSGLTEYDIDQSFIKFSQSPNTPASSQSSPQVTPISIEHSTPPIMSNSNPIPVPETPLVPTEATKK